MYKYIRAAKSAHVLEQGTAGEDIQYTLYSDGKLVIDGSGELTSGLYYSMSHGDDVKSIVISSPNVQVGDNVQFPNVESLQMNSKGRKLVPYAFEYCGNLKTAVLPDRLLQLPKCVFNMCESLESIKLPNTITKIGYLAFGRCKSLQNIDLPDDLKVIGESAFAYCSSLKNITIPAQVTQIDDYAFKNCSSLESITFEGDVNQIEFGEDVFKGTPIESEMGNIQ